MKLVILLVASFLLFASAETALQEEVDSKKDFKIPVLNKPFLHSVQISVEPAVVGALSATLSIFFTSEIDLPAKSIVKVQIPRQASLAYEEPYIPPGYEQSNGKQTTYFMCMIRGFESSKKWCEAFDTSLMELELPFKIDAHVSNEFVFEEIFNTPHSSQKTSSFYIQVLDEEREVIAASKPSEPSNQISNLKPARLANVVIEQLDNDIIGEPTNVVLTVTVWHPVPQGGGVLLKLPRWDSQQSVSGALGSIIAKENRKVECFAKMNIGIESSVETITNPSQLKCVTNNMPDFDLVMLAGCFPKGITAGETFSFVIKTIKNPISMTMLPIQVTTFCGVNQDSSAKPFEPRYFKGFIDQGIAEFRAKKPSPIRLSQCKFVTKNPTVQEMTNLIIEFKVPVPIHNGCMLLLTIPDDFHHDISTRVVKFWGGMFQSGPQNVLKEDMDNVLGLIKIKNQCRNYINKGATTSIQLNELKNPDFVAPSGDFKIQIYDINRNLIAETETGLKYTPTAGPINDVTLKTLDNKKEVGQVTNLMLSFTPAHRVNQHSVIRIGMPTQIEHVGCHLTEVKGLIHMEKLECVEKTQYVIEFKNLFNKGVYPGGEALGFTFKDVELPGSQTMIKGITIELYQLTKKDGVFSVFNLVDTISDSNVEFFAPDPVLLLNPQIMTTLNVTYTETAFTFKMQSASVVPQDGIIKLELPSEVNVANATKVTESCKGLVSMRQNIACKIEEPIGLGDSPTRITIKKGFLKGGLSIKQDFSFQINEGLVTPISYKTSSTFKVTTTDSQHRMINYIDSLFITMQDQKDIGEILVSSSSQIVGEISDHTIAFTTPTPLYDGYFISTFIPTQCEPPKPSELKCTSKSPMTKTLDCTIADNLVIIAVRKEKTQKLIPENTKIEVTITNVRNPYSTQPVDYFVEVQTNDFYNVSRQITYGKPLQMTEPREIKDFKFTGVDQRQQALTNITIDWKNMERYPKDVQFLIHFNPMQLSPHFQNNDFYLPCFFNNSIKVDCDVKGSFIVVKNILQSELQAGHQLALTINNILINVEKAGTTDSWSFISFSKGGTYQIDKISKGLSFSFKCNFPCSECEYSDPDKCKSCNSVPLDFKPPKNNATYSIKYDNKCWKNCPDGTYSNNNTGQCIKCDPKCKTCAWSIITNEIDCTSCDVGSAWPYHDWNKCVKKCEPGSFGNKNSASCELCKFPCETCSDTADNCQSCSAKNVDSIFYENTCLPQCPKGWVSPISKNQRSRDFCRKCEYDCEECSGKSKTPEKPKICQKCSSNCIECYDKPDQCTKCAQHLILNKVDNNCVQKCPLGRSIHRKRANVCDACDPVCLTCSQKPYHCTSCNITMRLDKKHKPTPTCKLSCDEQNGLTVEVNGQCKQCSDNCARCMEEPDHCTQCRRGMYMYDYKCVTECPIVDGEQYVSNYQKKCVIKGMSCPFGYDIEPSGNGCSFKRLVCETGMRLNYAKNACIPIVDEDMNFMPLLLIFAFIFAIIPIVSKIKAPDSFLTSNLIAVLSIFETIGMLRLLYQAYNYGIYPVTWMILIGIVFQYLINLSFAVNYFHEVCADTAFNYWRRNNAVISTIVSIMGILLNFKVYRLLFGKLLRKEEFNAILMEPVVFYRPFLLSNILCFICTMLFVIIGSSFGLKHVFWGYQLMLTCAQMLILEVLVALLMFLEFIIHDQMKPRTYTEIEQQDGNRADFAAQQERIRLQVQGGDDTSDEEVQQFYKTTKQVESPEPLPPQKQRKGGISKLKVQKRDQRLPAGNATADQLIQEDNIMNRLRLLNRCKSHREYRPPFFNHDASSDEDGYNCISAPGSPRSKLMLSNKKFQRRIKNLTSLYRMRDKKDNCLYIAGAVLPLDEDRKRSVECQTNMMELLGCCDLHGKEQPDSEIKERVVKVKKIKLSTLRMTEIPPFDHEDLIGEFEVDKKGNNIIIKNKERLLTDVNGRLVNRRGYFIDQWGNVITKRSVFIFYRKEVDNSDEIPAPYCYQKKEKLLFKVKAVKIQPIEIEQVLDQQACTKTKKDERREKRKREEKAERKEMPKTLILLNNKGLEDEEELGFLNEISRLKNSMEHQTASKQEQEQQEQEVLEEKNEEMMNQSEIVDSNDHETKEEKPDEEKPQEEKPDEEKPQEEKPQEEKTQEEKPQEEKQKEEKLEEEQPEENKPEEDKPKEDKPEQEKPEEDNPEEENREQDKQEEKQQEGCLTQITEPSEPSKDEQVLSGTKRHRKAAKLWNFLTEQPDEWLISQHLPRLIEELPSGNKDDQIQIKQQQQHIEINDVMERIEMKELKTKQGQLDRYSSHVGKNINKVSIFSASVHSPFRKRTGSQVNDSTVSLARRNLKKIQGRVRLCFNKQMRLENMACGYHEGLASSIVMKDQGSQNQNQQLKLQNAVVMQMKKPLRKFHSLQSSRQENDDQRLSKNLKSLAMTGSARDQSEDVNHQLAGIGNIVDCLLQQDLLLQQDRRPGSALHPPSPSNEAKRLNSDKFLSEKSL